MIKDIMIRVGTIQYVNGKKVFPEYKGYTRIEVMTPSTNYGELGPYVLKDSKGRIMENIWQFSKVYTKVPKTRSCYSRWDKTVIWDHPSEIHVDEKDKLTDEYWAWREKGMNNKYPVRYPVGFSPKARASCLYALWKGKKLNYIEARKCIYLQIYYEMVQKEKKYHQLKNMLKFGKKLLIVEVDGPRQESLKYYQEKYKVKDNFISNRTIKVTKKNMNIMLNDTKHPFGHGYCLAMALLGMISDKPDKK